MQTDTSQQQAQVPLGALDLRITQEMARCHAQYDQALQDTKECHAAADQERAAVVGRMAELRPIVESLVYGDQSLTPEVARVCLEYVDLAHQLYQLQIAARTCESLLHAKADTGE